MRIRIVSRDECELGGPSRSPGRRWTQLDHSCFDPSCHRSKCAAVREGRFQRVILKIVRVDPRPAIGVDFRKPSGLGPSLSTLESPS